jgi:DNA polymerase, archaea type
LFAKFQNEILEIMAAGNSIRKVQMLMPAVFEHFQKYKQLLKDGEIPVEELVFTKHRSKDFEYQINRNTVENNAMTQLSREGKSLRGGQILRYIITDYRRGSHYNNNNRNTPKATPLELIDSKTTYDGEKYTELLAQACNSIIEPFGYTIHIPISKSTSLVF